MGLLIRSSMQEESILREQAPSQVLLLSEDRGSLRCLRSWVCLGSGLSSPLPGAEGLVLLVRVLYPFTRWARLLTSVALPRQRSEERRVGKECRCRRSLCNETRRTTAERKGEQTAVQGGYAR